MKKDEPVNQNLSKNLNDSFPHQSLTPNSFRVPIKKKSHTKKPKQKTPKKSKFNDP
jgi:hypothetical protein